MQGPSPTDTGSASGLLCRLAIDTPSSDLPASAYDAATRMLLDSLAVAVGGWNADGIAAVLDEFRDWGGKGQSTVLVYGDRLPPPEAAFVNGAMIHALDYDDLYRPAALHLMASVLPSCLAAAEQSQATGRELLAGMILGVEVAARLGLAMRHLWKPAQAAGFLPSTIIGGFGATAAAARLLGLKVDQAVHAMGLYYAQNAGNRQALYDKTLTKRLQPAFAARAALTSCLLARRGITGPMHAIEGDAGLVRLYAGAEGDIDPQALRTAGRCWQIEQLAIKRFPSCGACHPLTQAALDLIADQVIEVADIKSVELYLGEGGNRMVGMPFELGASPQADAQFSVAYAVALVLLRHEAGIARYTSDAIRADRDVAALARQMIIREHMDAVPARQAFDDDEPFWVDQPHVLTVTMRDGRVLTRSRSIRDVLSPDPAGFETASRKMRDCAEFAGVFAAGQADAIIHAVGRLDQAASLHDLLQACHATDL